MSFNLVNLNQPSAGAMLDLINQENNLTLTADKLIFGTPSVGSTPTETLLDITPGSTSGLTGVKHEVYQRLDLATYFYGGTPVLYITDPATQDLVLAALLDQFQIYSAGTTGADSFTVTLNSDLTQATIVPNAGNYVWVGSLVAQINNTPTLIDLLTVTTLTGFALPANQSSSCPMAQSFYGLVNATSLVNEVQAMLSGDVFNQYQASWDIGTTLLDEPWVVNISPAPYNLYGSRVEYNGPATGAYAVPTSTGNWPGWVLVIALGAACTNRCGKLVFVYQPVVLGEGDPPLPPTPADPPLLYN